MRWLPSRYSLPWWLLLISLAFNLGFGATYGTRTYGPVGGWRRGPEGARMRERWREPLDLTDEQKARFDEINGALMEQIGRHRQQMRDARMELADLLIETEPDPGAIAVLLDEISAIQRDAQQLVVERLLQQKRLLEPGQLEAFNEVIRREVFSGGRMGGGMRRPGDRGGPPAGRERGRREGRGMGGRGIGGEGGRGPNGPH